MVEGNHCGIRTLHTIAEKPHPWAATGQRTAKGSNQ